MCLEEGQKAKTKDIKETKLGSFYDSGLFWIGYHKGYRNALEKEDHKIPF